MKIPEQRLSNPLQSKTLKATLGTWVVSSTVLLKSIAGHDHHMGSSCAGFLGDCESSMGAILR